MYFSRRALPIRKGPHRPAPLALTSLGSKGFASDNDDHEHDLRSISALSSGLSSGLSSRLSYDSGRRSSDSLSSKQGLRGPLKRMMAQGVPLAAPHADFADRDTGAGTEFTQEVRRSDLVKEKGVKVGLSYKLAAKAVRKMIAPKNKYDQVRRISRACK
jgi:hypothetical protein